METLKQHLEQFEETIDQYIQTKTTELKQQLKDAHCRGYVLGMSGGIDCCTVAALCASAEIPCYLVSMPYGKSMDKVQGKDAKLLSETFGLPLTFVDITKQVDETRRLAKEAMDSLGLDVSGNTDLAFANIAPRERMKILYDIAQCNQMLVLGTSNLSEIVMGYFTKWGDGAADAEPIQDLTKSEVRILANYLNVPQPIIDKAPSADLWEGQTDEKEMGMTYEEVDTYILCKQATEDVAKKIESAILRNKHKMSVFNRS